MEDLNKKIMKNIEVLGFNGYSIKDARLMLMELMVRVNNNHYVSCTEGQFVHGCCVLRKDFSPNKVGRKFLCDMLYASSNEAPEAYYSMREFKSHD